MINCVGSGNYICFWKSKGLSYEHMTPPAIADNSLAPKLIYFCTKTKVKFKESCLKQDKIAHNHGKVVFLHIVYEIYKTCNISRKLFIWSS